MRSEILTYSRSRGLFAGVSLEGSTLRPDNNANKKLYGKERTRLRRATGSRTGISSSRSCCRPARHRCSDTAAGGSWSAQLTPGDVVMFVAYLDRLKDPIDWLSEPREYAPAARTSMQPGALRLLQTGDEEPGGEQLSPGPGRIEFLNVRFGYTPRARRSARHQLHGQAWQGHCAGGSVGRGQDHRSPICFSSCGSLPPGRSASTGSRSVGSRSSLVGTPSHRNGGHRRRDLPRARWRRTFAISGPRLPTRKSRGAAAAAGLERNAGPAAGRARHASRRARGRPLGGRAAASSARTHVRVRSHAYWCWMKQQPTWTTPPKRK